MDEIMAYYTANSPLYLEQVPDDFADPLLRFEKRSIGFLCTEERPQITGVHFIDLDGDGLSNDIVVTDEVLGAVTWLKYRDGVVSESTIAEISAPVNVEPLDFDNDGDNDLAV